MNREKLKKEGRGRERAHLNQKKLVGFERSPFTPRKNHCVKEIFSEGKEKKAYGNSPTQA